MTDSAAAGTSTTSAENDADPILAPDILERRRHNDLLPIHRLPPELLCIIIAEVYRKGAYQGLFAVRSACKYWLSVVDSSPELWTSFSLDFDDDFLDMIFRNSKNHLLSVKLGYYRRHAGPENLGSFIQRVIPSVGRWKSLEYRPHWHRPNRYKEQIFSVPLPNLESLTMGGSTFGYDRPIDAPKLRFMRVPALCPAWASLSDLRTVKICQDSPSVDQLYVLLQKWPKLEALQIHQNPMLLLADNIHNLPSTPLFLPNLRSMVLSRVLEAPYSRLLCLIDAPNLRRFVIIRDLDDTDAISQLLPLFEPVGCFLGADRHSSDDDGSSLSRVRVVSSEIRFTIMVGRDRKLALRADPSTDWLPRQEDRKSILSTLLSAFDRRFSENVKVIQFGGTQCSEDLITLGPILQRHFPNVEELVVTLSSSRGRLEGPKLVLKTLRSPLPLEDGGGWLFPGLTALRLRTGVESTCDGILGVVEARGNGTAQAIQRIAIRKGRIRRDTVPKLKAYIKELRLDSTRYIESTIE
ncbi:hypothetical protein FRC04_011375 [Tulasnella sp. 424]|nr:hypothetical protein FRC04_011375 [Tulasnella sp. 424]KAG8972606.1 hypothetical protein FRC05_009716 [Tulasnella sp. 425]